MAKQPFTIIHNLDALDKPALAKYLADMSTHIGLDSELNGLDTIWMDDPNGGRALVPYARRGTCEILRNIYEVQVDTLTYATVGGSIVFTATGRSKTRGNRQEIAVGSKWIEGLRDKSLDNAIMTASTRALQRLTMQFTELGILAESEVVSNVGQVPNPAGSAQLAEGNSLPPVFLPPPAVPANNAPGKDVTPAPEEKAAPQAPQPLVGASTRRAPTPQYPDAPTTASVHASVKTFPGDVETEIGLPKAAEKAAKADKKEDISAPATAVTPAESATSVQPEPDGEVAKKAAKKTRKKANTVILDVEPEVVSNVVPPQVNAAVPPQVQTDAEFKAYQDKIHADAQAALTALAAKRGVGNVAPSELSRPIETSISAPPPQPSAPEPAAPVVEGLPTKEQMDAYRKRISVYTVQLPPSENLGSTQKMRAFITKLSGTPPQSMTVEQWDEVIGWFDAYVEKHPVKDLIEYINDLLGVK